jgi:hypothetical protein
MHARFLVPPRCPVEMNTDLYTPVASLVSSTGVIEKVQAFVNGLLAHSSRPNLAKPSDGIARAPGRSTPSNPLRLWDALEKLKLRFDGFLNRIHGDQSGHEWRESRRRLGRHDGSRFSVLTVAGIGGGKRFTIRGGGRRRPLPRREPPTSQPLCREVSPVALDGFSLRVCRLCTSVVSPPPVYFTNHYCSD